LITSFIWLAGWLAGWLARELFASYHITHGLLHGKKKFRSLASLARRTEAGQHPAGQQVPACHLRAA